MIDPQRLHSLNDAPVRGGGRYILYWMISARRTRWNPALERAVWWCRELRRPLLVLEPLRCDYPYASDRLHRFLLDGMEDNHTALQQARVRFHPYVEPERGAGKGLLSALAARACIVVTDFHPGFFYPRMRAAAASALDVTLEAVDGCGLSPLAAADRPFPRAHSFRRFLQKDLPAALAQFPEPDPLAGLEGMGVASVPKAVSERWPAVPEQGRAATTALLASLPIDHRVAAVPQPGGPRAAATRLREFLDCDLDGYGELRNHPDDDATSRLSPYLHFGHLSVHQVFAELMTREGWSEDLLARTARGARTGWWGVGESAEAFLDELVTWREVGFNAAYLQPRYDRYDSLPAWAQDTLEEHAADDRPYLYGRAMLERAATHDPLWNAAQTQLVREGRIHNYLRMLWGKKILEWSPSPREAFTVMLELNDRYALDGRDPNSVCGIAWCLGRYDRAWGPRRPVFGTVRYMSSRNTARKVRVKEYLRRYAPHPPETGRGFP